MRWISVLVLAALLTAAPSLHPTQAAAGDLDASFGRGGRVVTEFTSHSNFSHAVAIQPDGKILAAGESLKPFADWDFALARYNRDGSLDQTFGAGGKVTTDMGGRLDSIQAIAVQSDGKIVAVGQSFDFFITGAFLSEFAAARYNPDGSLDTTFGNGGKVITHFSSGFSFMDDSRAFAVAVQPDGKIIAAGSAFASFENLDFALVRYNANGSLDPTFGNGGLLTTNVGSRFEGAFGLELQPDGKIIASGYTTFGVDDFALVRYNPNGSLDPTFGSSGMVRTDFNDSGDQAFAMALQPDGKIILAGYTKRADTNYRFALARYEASGALDSSFGSGGKAVNEIFGSFEESARAVAVQPDGKIVVAGGGQAGFLVVRYNADGTLDGSFGDGGVNKTDFSDFTDEDGEVVGASAEAVAIQADGKIVAGGNLNKGFGAVLAFAMARYTGDQEEDQGFDVCLQDEGRGEFLQINSTTGDYRFTDCAGLTIVGTGALTQRASVLTLRHNASDRRVSAMIDTARRTGTASVKAFSQLGVYTITDRNTADNTCACR
ncbi:MAG TPA: delta-60 repeat domain-containing protein [Blastocatellia bacterium]|nr:delta-60 repeat domain-containing protein [Blastocatellia bacterium]